MNAMKKLIKKKLQFLKVLFVKIYTAAALFCSQYICIIPLWPLKGVVVTTLA